MYWKVICLVLWGSGWGLNEHVTACPSALHVTLPDGQAQYTIAITLTNTGTEVAELTLRANDTFNNAREKVWRAGQAYAPLLIPVATTEDPDAAGDDSTEAAVLRFEMPEIDGHGVLLAEGNLDIHPAVTGEAAVVPNSVVVPEPRRKWSSSHKQPRVDWHHVVIDRSANSPTLCTFGEGQHPWDRKVSCPHITTCVPRARWRKERTVVDLRFPLNCTDYDLTQSVAEWHSLLGASSMEVDEVLTVQGVGGIRGFLASGGGQEKSVGDQADSSSLQRAAATTSFDPNWPNEWPYSYEQWAYPLVMINGTKQWPVLANYPIASSPAVMVIDTYAQLNHSDLMLNYAVNEVELYGLEGVDDDGDGVIDNIWGLDGDNMEYGDPDWSQSIAHGTSVSGLIAARPNNDSGAAGIAPNLRVLPCGAGNSTMSMLATVECLHWAIDNAKRFNLRVINHSYTGNSRSATQLQAFRKLEDLGMINTVASGNEDRDLDALEPYTPLLYLAQDALYSIIGIGRLDASGAPAPSGHSKEWTQIYMPGELLIIVPPNGDEVAEGSGTSYAAPTTAGLIGGMLTVAPELGIFDVLWILENSIIQDSALKDLTKWGGYVNASLAIEHAIGTWIVPLDKKITLQPGESKTAEFLIDLNAAYTQSNSQTAYINILGTNDTRLNGVYKMGEIPVTVQLTNQ